MENENFNINDFVLSELIKHSKIEKVKSMLYSRNINLEFDICKESFFRGYCIKSPNEKNKYIIHINVKESLKEDLLNFNKRGVLGDVFNPQVKKFIPKSIEDIGVYSILYTLLHEYKHYIQYENGELDNIDMSLDKNNKYSNDNATILEEDAEMFALEHIYDLMQGYYDFFKEVETE